MDPRRSRSQVWLLLIVLVGVSLGTAGCHFHRNHRDYYFQDYYGNHGHYGSNGRN